MQRIIQINMAGRLVPIEEDAYSLLRDYLSSLERQFSAEPGREEIINDIENRMAELFAIRLQGAAPAIDKQDVVKVMETLGPASELGNTDRELRPEFNYMPATSDASGAGNRNNRRGPTRRLYRDPKERMLGGVCGGLGHYFAIDPVFIRIIFVALAFAGVGVLAYLIAWGVIPLSRTPLRDDGEPMNFRTVSENMTEELQALKKRGEEMSRELQDFFRKKK